MSNADLNRKVFIFLPKVANDKVLDYLRRSDGCLFYTVGTTKEKPDEQSQTSLNACQDKRCYFHQTFVDCELLLWVGRRGWDNLVDLSLGSSMPRLPLCTRFYIGLEASAYDEALEWCDRIFFVLVTTRTSVFWTRCRRTQTRYFLASISKSTGDIRQSIFSHTAAIHYFP